LSITSAGDLLGVERSDARSLTVTDMTSTQPTDVDGYETTRFNALRHGVLSRYTVLPWEDQDEYCRLLEALVAEHKPKGPTEEHLVEEMAGVLWRKRRLRLAEAAAYRRGLKNAASSDQQTVKAALAHLDVGKQSAADTTTELTDLDQRKTIIARALDLLQSGKARAYDKALGALTEEAREQWEERIKRKPGLHLLDFDHEQNRYTADADGLQEFLQEEALPGYEARRNELQNQPLIREQIIGQALDADKLEGLARYEVHLDRKLERMLTMLVRLQERRDPPHHG
jgi:hypothetical protein